MNDFADGFSPIIVKELRQGMRAKAFMGIFLIVQFFMIICVLVSLGNDSDSRDSVTAMFWMFIGVAILLLMPLRGFATLNGEMKGNTLELMLLTQLSAWRITAGKWLALFLQTLLLVCAVLPYVVLRYFLGGVNLVNDLSVLGWMLIGSALATALAVGLSPFMQSVVLRVVLGLGMVGSFVVIPEMLFGFGMRSSSAPSMTTWLLAAALLGPLLVLEIFELGVGKIAPAAENHGTRKRFIVAVLLAIAVVLGRVQHEQGFLLVLATLAIAPICLGTLMEETVAVPSIYRPFLRRGFLGRIAGRILYPGWGSGLLFFLLIGGVILWLAPIHWEDNQPFFNVVAGLEAIFAPLFLVRLCFRRAKSILPFYFGLQLCLFVLAIIFSANFDHNEHRLVPMGCVPTLGFFLSFWRNDVVSDTQYVRVVVGAVAAVSLLGLLILSIKEWKIMARMEGEAARLE